MNHSQILDWIKENWDTASAGEIADFATRLYNLKLLEQDIRKARQEVLIEVLARLSPQESTIFTTLYNNLGKLVRDDVLIKAVWGIHCNGYKARHLTNIVNNMRVALVGQDIPFEVTRHQRRGYSLYFTTKAG